MRAKRRGFTLVELMIVVTIIGILLSFILKAYLGSIRRAEHSATVSLIAKLESALTDRIDALTTSRADPNATHYNLSAIWPAGGGTIPSNQRAQVFAQFDMLRAELPDVFVLSGNANYPLNFAMAPFPPGGTSDANFALPLGQAVLTSAGGSWPGPPAVPVPVDVTGMYGASFSAAGAFYKQLGYGPKGTDGADNDQDGLIDERDEGNMGLSAAEIANIDTRLASHKHRTARAEALYAILVEGTGPLGSVFSKDDFNVNEVKDTDGDGLLEFVDGFGEPLQFFRWPIMYHSDTQKGFPDLAKLAQDAAAGVPPGPYSTVYESREQDPLDPNQQLQAPGWFGSFNSAYPFGSPRGVFASYFHTLIDPLAATAGAPSNSTYWDRSTAATASMGYYTRRAYYSRFLVLSGGPDKMPGVAQLGVNYQGTDERIAFPTAGGGFSPTRDTSGALVPVNVLNVIQIENQGGRIDPNRDANGCPIMSGTRNDTNTQLEEYGNDDITSMNLHSAGGPLPSPGK